MVYASLFWMIWAGISLGLVGSILSPVYAAYVQRAPNSCALMLKVKDWSGILSKGCAILTEC